MKKFKNKFIIWVICLIVVIVFSQVYRAYSSSVVDTNSYLSLIKGKGTLNDNFIVLDTKYELISGDVVRTIGKESLAVIEWWDGSVTRLGWNTKISVGQNEVTRDYSRINISFDLIAGKTWSNVVSFIGKDSSFTQSFQWVEAGVRGTVFDVDLEKWFVNVTDHQVELIDHLGKVFVINEENPFSLETFSFIELSEFIRDFKDKAWTDLNEQFDEEYINQLKADLEANLQSNNPLLFIMEVFSPKYRFLYALDTGEEDAKLEKLFNALTEKQKQEIRPEILERYQKLNFVSSSDTENYEKKLLYKEILLNISEPEDQENLIRYTLYDFQDIIKNNDTESFESTLTVLNNHKDIVKQIDTSFFTKHLNLIPDDLERIMQEEFEGIKNFFEAGIPDVSGVNVDSGKEILDTAKDAVLDNKEKLEDSIGKGLDSLFENVTN